MTSHAKVESNRRNAQRSTGPSTRAGKVASSKNAMRHGLLSQQITLPNEDVQAFAEFQRDMTTKLTPTGALEELLAERIISNAWRLRRTVGLEAGVIAFRTREAQAELAEPRPDGDAVAAGLIRDAAGADALSKLSRYERALERGLYRALHELQRIQAASRGETVPPPAVLDIQVSSGDS